jgi:adenylyltransferase/sulfurtransferase
MLARPYVYGAVSQWEGQVAVFGAPGGPCYRCLFREPPPSGMVMNCAEGGVLGVLPGIVGSMQALEAIKLILGTGRTLAGRLLLFDAMESRFREIELRRNPDCPVCGDHPTQTGLIDYDLFCGVPAAGEAGAASTGVEEVEPEEALRRLTGPESERPFLLDVREPWEWEVANLGAHGAHLVPLRELPDRLSELPEGREILVYCRSGGRSTAAGRVVLDAGFERVGNLAGGLCRWADTVDPEMPIP